eukprot:2249766-Pyramimonas_sp.AAC.1
MPAARTPLERKAQPANSSSTETPAGPASAARCTRGRASGGRPGGRRPGWRSGRGSSRARSRCRRSPRC